ncbi:hypothetical protein JYG23_12975 [Sedimentibacter sp. zth1]|uniref:hypothetical protein n=1 Tax=Sedimentibacter sp. zth1 TaxID=2816908 RepID=UPI001A9277CF|nr:hypothetical protein [Sedimentibacter sp. zth1]QSX05573.1 hypothetical protein JYG23_12975 [Sedimentibacter sp. zth1]
MYAIFLVLNDVYKLDEVHELFYEEEIGATTIDSQGMGNVLLNHHVNVPMLANVRKLIEGRKPYNKTIFTVVDSEEKKRSIVDKIKGLLDNFEEPGLGFMFVVPVVECYGTKKDIEKY